MGETFCYAFPRPAVTADAVVFTREPRPRVLLVRRAREPFAGAWALPGGFVDIDEDLEPAAHRELEEETGVRGLQLTQLRAFGRPDRDPRGRTISVAYFATADPAQHPLAAADDAAEAAWHPLDALPPLAFDHAEIIEYAVNNWENRNARG